MKIFILFVFQHRTKQDNLFWATGFSWEVWMCIPR